MNYFDKEERIINFFQTLKRHEVYIYPKNIKTFKLYKLIHSKKLWKNWINTSGKSDPPPDYYNNSNKMMIDVMRIDDHSFVNDTGNTINLHNRRESEIISELSKKNPALKEAADEGRILIIPDSGLRGDQDHNYDYYVHNFKRVIGKHIEKIPLYQQYHPDFKTIFFVFDESSPYMVSLDGKRPTEVGELFYADPHFWWADANMLNVLKNSKVDYLIWFSPFKHFDSVEKFEMCKAIIYDLSRFEFENLVIYNAKDMFSAEL